LIAAITVFCILAYILARLEVQYWHGEKIEEEVYSGESLGERFKGLFISDDALQGTKGNVERQVAAHTTHSHSKKKRFLASSNEELRQYFDDLVRYYMLFLTVVYNTICIKAFAAFLCMDNPTYDEVLNRDQPQRILKLIPEVGCDTSEHKMLKGIAIMMIILYVVGLPLFLGIVSFVGYSSGLLNHPSFLRRYGWTYQRYETHFFFWELVIMLRRVSLCAALVFLGDKPFRQALVGFAILITSFSAQVALKPFRSELIDFIDSAGIYVNTLYIIVGILSSVDSFEDERLLSYILLVSIIFVCICGICAVAKEFQMAYSRSKSASFLAKILPGAITEHPELVENKQNRLLKLLDKAFDTVDADGSGIVSIEELRFALRQGLHLEVRQVNEVLRNAAMYITTSFIRSEEKGVNRQKFRQLIMEQVLLLAFGETTFQSPIERNFAWDPLVMVYHLGTWVYKKAYALISNKAKRTRLEEMLIVEGAGKTNMEKAILVCRELIRALRTIQGADKNMDSFVVPTGAETPFTPAGYDEEELEEDIGDVGLVAELLSSFRHHAFQRWLLNEPDTANILLFHNLDSIMGSYIADTGYASAYTMSSEALVFNELAEKFPYLIDYVINEDQTANENFREMVTELIAVREHHANHVTLHGGKDPSLGALVTNIDRGAILHWLVHAPQSRRKQFRTLLENIRKVDSSYQEKQVVYRTLSVGLRATKSYGRRLFGVDLSDASLRNKTMQKSATSIASQRKAQRQKTHLRRNGTDASQSSVTNVMNESFKDAPFSHSFSLEINRTVSDVQD